jgi:hypothetical protein
MQQFVQAVPVRFRCHDYGAIAGLDCLANEATQGVQKKSIRLIELHEVVCITHLPPIRARGMVALGDIRHIQANHFLSRINFGGGFVQENSLTFVISLADAALNKD